MYTLDENHRPVPSYDVLLWAKWIGEGDHRRIGDDWLLGDTVRVSTVFLGIDHNWGGLLVDNLDAYIAAGGPVLWETMIFGGALDQWGERYSSHDAAVRGHAVAIAMVLAKAGN